MFIGSSLPSVALNLLCCTVAFQQRDGRDARVTRVMRDFRVARLEPKPERIVLVCPIPQKHHPRSSPRRPPPSAPSWPPSDPLDTTVRGRDRRRLPVLIDNHGSSPATLSAPRAMQHTFGGKYRIEEAIANGGCGAPFSSLFPPTPHRRLCPTLGSVYLGTHTVAGKEVAIKLQPTVPRNSPIRQESKIYKTLSGSPGIPWIMWSGKHGDFDVMILDLLGPSLEDLFKMCNKHFSLKTVLLIADQLVSPSPLTHVHTTAPSTSPA